MNAARAQIAAIRAQLDALEASLGEHADELLDLDDAATFAKTTACTLRRWASEGRLACVELERRKLACWRSELERAINAVPYRPAVRAVEPANDDPFEQALASGELKSGRR